MARFVLTLLAMLTVSTAQMEMQQVEELPAQEVPVQTLTTVLLSVSANGEPEVVGVVRHLELPVGHARRFGPFYGDAEPTPQYDAFIDVLSEVQTRFVLALRCHLVRQRMLDAMQEHPAARGVPASASASASAGWATAQAASGKWVSEELPMGGTGTAASAVVQRINFEDEGDDEEGKQEGERFWRPHGDHRHRHEEGHEPEHRHHSEGPHSWFRPRHFGLPFGPHHRKEEHKDHHHHHHSWMRHAWMHFARHFGLHFGPPPRHLHHRHDSAGGQSEPGFPGLLGGDEATWAPRHFSSSRRGGAIVGNGAFLDWMPQDHITFAGPPGATIDWSFWDDEGRLNWPVLAFALLSAGCSVMWVWVFMHAAKCMRAAAGCAACGQFVVDGGSDSEEEEEDDALLKKPGKEEHEKGARAAVVATDHAPEGQFVTVHSAPLS